MFLILSFVLLFFQNINAAKNNQEVPTVAQVEAAVADFGRQIKQILGPIKSDNELSREVAKFRKKLVDMYMPAWIDKIDKITVRQRIGTVELPIFYADINPMVEEFKKNEQIPDDWNYQFLLDHYKRKLVSHYINPNSTTFEKDIISYLVNRLVNQQLAMPDEKGQEILLKDLLRQISATKLVKNLETELVEREFKAQLNQKFLY